MHMGKISYLRIPFITAFCILSLLLRAQSTYIPLNSEAYHMVDRLDIKYGKVLPSPYTGSQPFSRRRVANFAETLHASNIPLSKVDAANVQWLMEDNSEWLDSVKIASKRPILRYFYREPAQFYSVRTKKEDFVFKINPMLDIAGGFEAGQKGLLLRNTRGVEIRASLKKRVSLYLYVWENQTLDPLYVRNRVTQQQAIPGYGYWKEYHVRGYDFFDYRGYINFQVLKHIDIQFGHDKNFIGDGYRSMFLSDNSAPYFFLKLNTRIWKFNYQNIFAELTGQYTRGGDRLLDKKYGAFHYLSVDPTHWLSLGVFEGVIMTRKNQFELQYLNPIIFYRSVEQSLGSPDNAVVGINAKANFLRHAQFYGQFLFDEFNFGHLKAHDGWWANKFAAQAGIKYVDFATIKNLDVQLEFNMAKPYTYTHSALTNQQIPNYTHYNQQLANPLGANFYEMLGIVRYQPIPKLSFTLKYMYAVVGSDTGKSNWGSNIFKASNDKTVMKVYGNTMTQGVKHNISNLHFITTYQVVHGIYFDLELSLRTLRSSVASENATDAYFMLGTRWNVPYRSYDF